eukprot:520001-Prorocentrum_minimum.AAC.1
MAGGGAGEDFLPDHLARCFPPHLACVTAQQTSDASRRTRRHEYSISRTRRAWQVIRLDSRRAQAARNARARAVWSRRHRLFRHVTRIARPRVASPCPGIPRARPRTIRGAVEFSSGRE